MRCIVVSNTAYLNLLNGIEIALNESSVTAAIPSGKVFVNLLEVSPPSVVSIKAILAHVVSAFVEYAECVMSLFNFFSDPVIVNTLCLPF